MQIFFAPGISGSIYRLDERESRHCIRVLRMERGTPVKLIDGSGNLYEGIIDIPDPKGCQIRIDKVINDFETRPYRLHIAISPLKNPERFEFFIEKSVEIGVDEITPVICKNTEKQTVKEERINNIIISAMKQSIKAKITLFNKLCSFDDFIVRSLSGTKIIAHCNPNDERKGIGEVYSKGKDAVILIGPEGDFSFDEIRSASSNGFLPVHLGMSRLRTETAGIAACHSVYLLNQ
jgi:16S rRNA (uracil1498-N3)-methyltransferase